LATSDGLLDRPEELVGQLVVCEATAEVISRSAIAIPTAAVALRDMAVHGGGPRRLME